MPATSDPKCTSPVPTPEQLTAIAKLYDQGVYLQAYRESEEIGPLQRWEGTDARLLAARLAANLGGQRLAHWLLLTTWRSDRRNPRACWFQARRLLDSRGPWAALQFMKTLGTFPDAGRQERSHWLSLYAHVYGRTRDFDNAAKWLAQAEELGGDDPWVLLERAGLATLEDREEDGIRSARRALEIHPWHRAAVQWLGHFLVQNEQDVEALQLLEEASRRLESYAVTFQLAELQLETGRYQDACDSFEQCERLAPLLDKAGKEGLSARRSEAAYRCGCFEQAAARALEAKGRFYEVMAERLKDPPAERGRVCLPVGFVRQHHWTCAPATMASICRFWSMPGEHLEVAAAITYAGTPNHSERQWAIDHDWYTKEFTVTWDSARTLLNAGIPFSLSTTEVGSSHLQAVIGYDDLRNTLIIRDPGDRRQVEMLAEGLDRYQSSGPRGLAMVPMKERQRLESLALPDAALYDQIFRMERALEIHDRAGAEETYRQLVSIAGEHRMALLAERMLAAYDADAVRLLASLEKLSKLFPEDLRLQLSKVSSLRDLARRGEYLDILDTVSKQPRTDPAFWEQYAQELAQDGRTYREAARWLKRSMRVNPTSARAFSILAGLCWSRRRLAEAFDLSRMAACLEETNEQFARSSFEYANLLGRSEEGLDFLRRRHSRLGRKSGQPAQSLAWALFLLERTDEGYAVLEQAIALRPDDADLPLAVVDQYVQHGKFEDARRIAARAKKKSYRGAWLRSVAHLEAAQGNLVKARNLWARVLDMQPLAEDAHRSYVRLVAETVGRHAALEHLHGICARFPHHFQLTQLLMERQYEDGPEAVEPVVRKLIDLHPSNAWAWRQLAMILSQQHRLDEAFAALAAAEPLEPGSVGYHNIHGALLKQAGRFAEAKEAFRAALRISADTAYAMGELLSVCESPEERADALAFIEEEMGRQVLTGSGLLSFRDLASGSLDAPDLLAFLRKAQAARPDLWQAWAAVIRQLRSMVALEEALEAAKASVERFPLVADLWVDLADVHQARMDETAAIEALQTAHGINPFWTEPVRALSELYRRRDEFEKADTLIESAIARSPLKPENYAVMARFQWNSGKRHEGFARMRRTIELDPGWEGAWDTLCDWAANLNCFQVVVELAREQIDKRPGEIRSWMRLAHALRAIPGHSLVDDPERQEECLAALDRVLQLQPWHVEAHDLKAQILAESGRWLEAQTACQAPVWNGRPPTLLRGRLAWISRLRGDTETAVELMAETLRADPEYYWGWSNLAEWYEQLGRHAECLEAAERLIGFDPYVPVNYVRRAEAKRAMKDRAGAKADYKRAVQLAPDYLYPLFQLFDMHVEDGETEVARELLNSADPTEARADFLLRSLLLAKIEQDADTAMAALEDLCSSGNEEQIQIGIRALEEAGLGAAAEDVLYRFLGSGMRVCNQWVKLEARRSSLTDVHRRIRTLAPRHLARLNVIVACANAITETGNLQELDDWIRENELILRSKTWSWGQIGSCYSRNLADERTAAWMHDWKERTGVEPWMAMNLSLAVRGLDRFAEGAVINRYVLDNFDSDYTSIYHRTWLVLDDALAADVAAVERFFQEHELSELDANHRWIAGLAQVIFTCLTRDDSNRVLEDIHDELNAAASELEPIDDDRVFELAYRKSIMRIAQICGASASAWERAHLETPVLPKRKPKPGGQI